MTTVDPPEPAVPAGWYRDPLGIPQLRWWSGTAWTNRIQEDRAEPLSWSIEPAAAPVAPATSVVSPASSPASATPVSPAPATEAAPVRRPGRHAAVA